MDTRIAGIIGKVFEFGIIIIGVIMFLMILTGNGDGVISSAISLSLYSIYIAAGIAVLFGKPHWNCGVYIDRCYCKSCCKRTRDFKRFIRKSR